MGLVDWLKRRRQADDDLQEEIRSHLALAAEDRETDGAGRQEARFGALKEFGNVTLTTEAARAVWRPQWIESVRDWTNDARYAIRVLSKSPGFSLVVIGVLALGIGLNAAVFTFFKGLALEPLPGVKGSGNLGVVLSTTAGGRQDGLSYPDYKYLREHDQSFAGLSGSAMSMMHLGVGKEAQRVMSEFVTGNYFDVLGVRARLGRTLLPSDEVAPGQHPVVVLADGLWRRAFGADRNIVGKTVHLNTHPFTVVGVAEPAFHGTVVSFDIELFVPFMMAPELGLNFQAFQNGSHDMLSDRGARLLMVLGRPRPGTTLTGASAQTAVLSSQLTAESPLDEIAHRLVLVPIWQSPYGAQTYLLPAIAVVGVTGILLLLIVCASIAGLVLVRGVSRRGELAVRLALGASRARIVRLLLVESLVLAIPGAVLGLLLVDYMLPFMWSAAADAAPGRMYLDLSVDGLVVGFAAAAACASVLFFGFVPALRSSRIDLMTVMKEDLSPRGASRSRFRSALVVSQVALSLLLLVGAGLVARSLDAATRADAGFESDDVTSVTLDLAPTGYDEARGRAFYRQLLDSLAADPHTVSATLASIYPMTMVEFPGQKTEIDGYPSMPGEPLVFLTNTVAPGYFNTLRIRLQAGREFDVHDDHSAAQVAIVNETLARRFWGSAAGAVGKRLRLASGDWRTVVGVARDVKYARINEEPRPFVYVPFFQSYQPSMMVHVRGKGAPDEASGIAMLLGDTRRHVAAIDPDLPIQDARSLTAQTGAALSIFVVTAAMLLLFGAAAMGLAAMGIYGLVSYTVRQSTHEIGIRMALGAQRAQVVRRFLGRGIQLGVIGIVIGIVGALAATRFLGVVLYGVAATDAVSFVSAVVVVLGAVLVATLIPAWRGAKTDVIGALRHQG